MNPRRLGPQCLSLASRGRQRKLACGEARIKGIFHRLAAIVKPVDDRGVALVIRRRRHDEARKGNAMSIDIATVTTMLPPMNIGLRLASAALVSCLASASGGSVAEAPPRACGSPKPNRAHSKRLSDAGPAMLNPWSLGSSASFDC